MNVKLYSILVLGLFLSACQGGQSNTASSSNVNSGASLAANSPDGNNGEKCCCPAKFVPGVGIENTFQRYDLGEAACVNVPGDWYCYDKGYPVQAARGADCAIRLENYFDNNKIPVRNPVIESLICNATYNTKDPYSCKNSQLVHKE